MPATWNLLRSWSYGLSSPADILGPTGDAGAFPDLVAILGRQIVDGRSVSFSTTEPKFRSQLSYRCDANLRIWRPRLPTNLAVRRYSRAPRSLLSSGPLFRYSDTWQLIINTGTSVVTFLMVFVIQNTQNRDSAAVQAKLDELIRVSAATNSLIGIETLTQEEIAEIRTACAARTKGSANGASRCAAENPQAAAAESLS